MCEPAGLAIMSRPIGWGGWVLCWPKLNRSMWGPAVLAIMIRPMCGGGATVLAVIKQANGGACGVGHNEQANGVDGWVAMFTQLRRLM